jgi:hypothetical protein
MSIREILFNFNAQDKGLGGYNEAVDQALAAIKDELMRVMPDSQQNESVSEYFSGYNACRLQMISAIEGMMK